MDDLDMLGRDFGLGARGKSNPMRSSAHSDSRSISDVFGGPPKYSSSSNLDNLTGVDYDSIFKSSEQKNKDNNNMSSSVNHNASSVPVYDKPVYDDDIFDGLPGLKSKSAATNVSFGDDVFVSIASPQTSKSQNQKSDFDDLLGNLGKNDKTGGENYRDSGSAKSNSSVKGFNDFLAGFGNGSSPASNRPISESRWGSVPTAGSKRGNALDVPFVVLESSSTPNSSSSDGFTNQLDEMAKFGKSRSVRAGVSSGNGRAFNDIDTLSSPSRSSKPESDTTREQKGNSSFRYSKTDSEKKVHVDTFQEPPLFDVPNVSTDFQRSFGDTVSPQYTKAGAQVGTSPVSEKTVHQFDDIWLTVSEIPLFTQPTAAPPPSRPPPPRPRQTSRSGAGSYSSSTRKKGDDLLSPSSYSQHSQSPKLARPASKGPPVSQFDELEDFAMGISRNSADQSANIHSNEESDGYSAAAASAAAMKDAMDKAEAKFRHAKEVREREYAKAARNREYVQPEKVEQDWEREFREGQERENEMKLKEDTEIEQQRFEKERGRERSRDIEREKGRQAVERATREARERAGVEARDRAAAETRSRAERAAVEKATAEARVRAERAAVQRAQAEARERAAAEAKVRAEKVAAEARERVAAEAAVARAEAEAKRRAERAAAERAASEVRERAAAEARQRSAASAKMNQHMNENDLESFFNMGRASSAPKARGNSTDPDQQFQSKNGSEAAKRTSTSSSNTTKASNTNNIVDDLSSIFGAGPSSRDFQEVEGETEERRRARLDRHQRTQERANKALAEKYQRDLQVQQEQEERHRFAETLDIEIKRWAAGKEGNLRALLSTLQYVLWPACGWQPISLTDLITGASVKKVYRKATLCIHPDKVQQKGATLQQKYIAEKVFDLLKEAWNKFNSEELF